MNNVAVVSWAVQTARVRFIGVEGIGLVSEGDDLARLIVDVLSRSSQPLCDGDILVVSHTIVSKAEGRVVHRSTVRPSKDAIRIAGDNGWDPVHVELALRESKAVLRSRRALITERPDGLVCNFGGVDKSNAPPDCFVLLPLDADASARHIRQGVQDLTGHRVAVIVADTQGRPWRRGGVNVAVGVAGIGPFKYNRGRVDLRGRVLRRSTVCQADELAAAAETLMGQADEGVPVVLIRGYRYEVDETAAAVSIPRPAREDLFR